MVCLGGTAEYLRCSSRGSRGVLLVGSVVLIAFALLYLLAPALYCTCRGKIMSQRYNIVAKLLLELACPINGYVTFGFQAPGFCDLWL